MHVNVVMPMPQGSCGGQGAFLVVGPFCLVWDRVSLWFSFIHRDGD